MPVFMVLVAFLFLCLFLGWQFKVLKKYSLNFDVCKLDIPNKSIYINKKRILMMDVNYIDVLEGEQPSVTEKMFTRYAIYQYMTDMVIYLKDGSVEKCSFNSKGLIYKVLKQLEPYVRINADIEAYNPGKASDFISFWVIIIAAVLIVNILILLLK
ncbi:hypothetical protein IKP85_04220 [bacterium]|nr:hypothetical protein [bacterium]